MYEGPPRDGAETEYRRRNAPIRRPDRIALWAVGMALVAMIAAAASAQAA
jgi:fatty acid desaturase